MIDHILNGPFSDRSKKECKSTHALLSIGGRTILVTPWPVQTTGCISVICILLEV